MRIIALLLASVEASKLTSRASAKNKAEFFNSSEFDSLFGDLNASLDALDTYDYDTGSYSYTNDWDTDYSNWWETPTYDAGSCVNTDNGATNSYNEDCSDYEANQSWCGFWDGNGFVSNDMCCVCGGGETPEEPAAGQCFNTDNGAQNWYNEDCTDYEATPSWCGLWDGNGFVSESMCCVCGGGQTVTPVEPETPEEPEDQCFWWNEQEWAGVASSNPAWTVCGLDVCTPCGETPEAPAAGQCVNTDNGAQNWYNEDCTDYEANESWCGFWDGNGFVSNDMCCICGGGETAGAAPAAEAASACEANEDKVDAFGDTCSDYWSSPSWCGYTSTGFDSNADCCACQ